MFNLINFRSSAVAQFKERILWHKLGKYIIYYMLRTTSVVYITDWTFTKLLKRRILVISKRKLHRTQKQCYLVALYTNAPWAQPQIKIQGIPNTLIKDEGTQFSSRYLTFLLHYYLFLTVSLKHSHKIKIQWIPNILIKRWGAPLLIQIFNIFLIIYRHFSCYIVTL